jgi:hypothetical protein
MMKVKEIKTERVSREYVVEQFGEEEVARMERDWMLGVKRKLVKHSLSTRIKRKVVDLINSLLNKLI